MADCIFCKIAAGEIPAAKVFENDWVVAFNDIAPKAPVHVLLVPREHVKDISEAEAGGKSQLLGKMLESVAVIARKMGIEAGGYRVIINCGPDGGQEVDHLHVHILGGRRIGPMVAR